MHIVKSAAPHYCPPRRHPQNKKEPQGSFFVAQFSKVTSESIMSATS